MKTLTREQVREVDRRAIEDFGVPGVVLMENAGRGAASSILRLLSPPGYARVAIVCGAGNNGGDGFVIARHLDNRGVPVALLVHQPAEALKGDARINCEIAERMGLPMEPLLDAAGRLRGEAIRAALADARVIVDALLGTGFSGALRPPLDAVIELMNAAAGTRVAIDVPSGLDCDTGTASGAAVHAHLTVTFVAPKVGFDSPGASAYTGRVEVVDIGAPRQALDF